jgi:hypothetical protein
MKPAHSKKVTTTRNQPRRVKFKTSIAAVVTDIIQSQAKKQEEQAQINAITANMISHMTLPSTPAPTVATVTTNPAVAAAANATGPSPNLIAARLVNRIQAIRVFAARVTPIFANKKHALNN